MLASSFAVSVLAVWFVWRPDSWFAHLDAPNHRSLHSQPTASGGGIGIVLGVLTGGMILVSLTGVSLSAVLLGAVGIVLAVVGYVDDRGALTTVVRFAIQTMAAVIVVFFGPKLLAISVADVSVGFPDWLAAIFTGLFVIWMINLYNFMDGMDGFAGTMAVVGFGTLGWLGYAHGADTFTAVAWIIAASSLGFLTFNFPPARIFMGDTGSTALGYAAAVMVLWADSNAIAPFWVGVLIFSPFIVDSTVTLIRRALAGERCWEAHRSHYYQRLVGLGWTHRRTLLAEIVLMLSCALSAAISFNQPQYIQWLTVIFWVVIYLILMYAVPVMEASRTRIPR